MAGTATETNKERAVNVRITDEQDRRLDEEATRTGLSRSDLVRLALLAYFDKGAVA